MQQRATQAVTRGYDGSETGLTQDFRPSQRIDLKSRLLDGEIVVLDRDGGFVHQFNTTASYIWERCNGQHTLAEIAAQVCEMFEVDQEAALKDVIDSVRQLQKLRLLQN